MKSDHCHSIDYLRVLGASSVLLYHYTFRSIDVNGLKYSIFPLIEKVTKYGYLGVNLFFIISGFVILFSASNKSPLSFAFSRADRLYPTYWACVTISLLAIFIFDISPPNLYVYLANLTMLNDYLHIKNIDGVYWTLQVELKFYFLIFVLMTTKLINKHYIYLSVWLLTAYLFYFTRQPFFMGWIISPNYSSFFISGISLYLLYNSDKSIKNILILFFSILLSTLYSYDQPGGFIKNVTEGDRLIACSIVLSVYFCFILIVTKNFLNIKNAIIVRLSALTYSIYLIHASVGKRFFDNISNIYNINIYISLIISICLIVFISFLINKFVEIPSYGIISKTGNRLVSKFMSNEPTAGL